MYSVVSRTIVIRMLSDGKTVNKFDFYHDIVVDDDENIYVANIGHGQAFKSLKRPLNKERCININPRFADIGGSTAGLASLANHVAT